MNISFQLKSPLFTDWSEQYVKLILPAVNPGTALMLSIDDEKVPFQYTGNKTPKGAEILVKIGFAKGESKELVFSKTTKSSTDLSSQKIPLDEVTSIGAKGRELLVGARMPLIGFAGNPMCSTIVCESKFESTSLHRNNDGPLFTDYELNYSYAQNRHYTIKFRCYKSESYVEVSEIFSLQMNAKLIWTLNPEKRFTHIISRDSFEKESGPTVEPLSEEHPRDLLCRLQMPMLNEYVIPNNRGWFAFFNEINPSRNMMGIMGLYGAKWEEPVVNMPELFNRNGTVEWHASLASGKRYWLLYTGPVEKHQSSKFGGDNRFIFHRLHAEFNALRLDEHLDLSGDIVFDASCSHEAGALGETGYHQRALRRMEEYPCIRDVFDNLSCMGKNEGMYLSSFSYLLDSSPGNAEKLYAYLIKRFELWVRQFQGYRTGKDDYMKSVIGFTRYLRGMMLAYEQLRRDDALSDEQVKILNSYFAFAARRILDEGRWPHSRTTKHPDHPESARDFYTYGGEHKVDRLFWTNSLPNFQSDPLCALAHLSAIFKDHPDASYWLRFALDDIDEQLNAYCGKSGAWQESINYALYTFSYFIISFKAIKERWGIDYFNDERVRRYASWLCRFMGPVDKRFGVHTMPGIGNVRLPQLGAEYLLCYANELADGDPLKQDCLALWNCGKDFVKLEEHYPVVMSALAPEPPASVALKKLTSECMDEVGVSIRDHHGEANETYLFQKIGFAKDHYEDDETAFNWYAKGTPLCMDYGTYTKEVSTGAAHNIIEIPDSDGLRRGYLADHLFTSALDYTRCEVPVSLKLLWGKVRSFEEVDNQDGIIDQTRTPYYYIGDKNPLGPKTWKMRQLLFVKPDYTVIFDRVYGQVPHRYNLHFTGKDIRRDDTLISANGRFDLDLLVHVQHPNDFKMETGELIPNVHPDYGGEEARAKHAQHYFRLTNQIDGIYRTLIFARERGRDVKMTNVGNHGIKIITQEYTDYVFVHNDFIHEETAEVSFSGKVGWIRKTAGGDIQAVVPDGDFIEAFGLRLQGRGPWSYNLNGHEKIKLHGGAPRQCQRYETI